MSTTQQQDYVSPSAVPVNMPSVAEANNHMSDLIRTMLPSPHPADAPLLTTAHFQDLIVSTVIPRLCAKVGVSVVAWRKDQLSQENQHQKLPTSCSAERNDDDDVPNTEDRRKEEGNDVDVDVRLIPASVINVVDADGRTAFHWALSMKRFDVAQALMEAPFNANTLTVDLDGATTLTTACSVDCPSALLSSLLSAAATIAGGATATTTSSGTPIYPLGFFNAQDTAGNTALQYIASRGNTRALKLLLAAIPADVFLTYRTVDITKKAPATATVEPSVGCDTKAAATTTADSTAAVTPALSAAAAIELLNYPNPFTLNKRRQTILHRAMARGASDFVEELMSWMKRRVASPTANVDPSKAAGSSDAVSNKATVRHFINSQDIQGNTALHYAALENNQDLGQVLLRNGADRDIRNKDGQEFWKL